MLGNAGAGILGLSPSPGLWVPEAGCWVGPRNVMSVTTLPRLWPRGCQTLYNFFNVLSSKPMSDTRPSSFRQMKQIRKTNFVFLERAKCRTSDEEHADNRKKSGSVLRQNSNSLIVHYLSAKAVTLIDTWTLNMWRICVVKNYLNKKSPKGDKTTIRLK